MARARPELSVIVPTLDEAATLPALLTQLSLQRGLRLQVVVADGGSRDDTRALAAAAGAVVVTSGRGRGRQMNAGREVAHAPLLLFLHADSGLPAAPDWLHRAVACLKAQGPTRVAGHFALRFQRQQSGHDWLFRYLEGKTRLTRPGTVNGDQGLLIPAEWFDALGGYDESLPFFEDQRLAAQIFRHGRMIRLPGTLLTSARRFESEGHYRRWLLMALMMLMEGSGCPRFFEQAPALYRQQSATDPLRIAPFLRLAAHELRRGGPSAWRGLAHTLRANAWQLPYAARVSLHRSGKDPAD